MRSGRVGELTVGAQINDQRAAKLRHVWSLTLGARVCLGRPRQGPQPLPEWERRYIVWGRNLIFGTRRLRGGRRFGLDREVSPLSQLAERGDLAAQGVSKEGVDGHGRSWALLLGAPGRLRCQDGGLGFIWYGILFVERRTREASPSAGNDSEPGRCVGFRRPLETPQKGMVSDHFGTFPVRNGRGQQSRGWRHSPGA